jgi:hypothetical protein
VSKFGAAGASANRRLILRATAGLVVATVVSLAVAIHQHNDRIERQRQQQRQLNDRVWSQMSVYYAELSAGLPPGETIEAVPPCTGSSTLASYMREWKTTERSFVAQVRLKSAELSRDGWTVTMQPQSPSAAQKHFRMGGQLQASTSWGDRKIQVYYSANEVRNPSKIHTVRMA